MQVCLNCDQGRAVSVQLVSHSHFSPQVAPTTSIALAVVLSTVFPTPRAFSPGTRRSWRNGRWCTNQHLALIELAPCSRRYSQVGRSRRWCRPLPGRDRPRRRGTGTCRQPCCLDGFPLSRSDTAKTRLPVVERNSSGNSSLHCPFPALRLSQAEFLCCAVAPRY